MNFVPVVSRQYWDRQVPARHRCLIFWRVAARIGPNVVLLEAVWRSTVSAVANIPSSFVNWRSATFPRSLTWCLCWHAGRPSTLPRDWNWRSREMMKILGITLWVLRHKLFLYYYLWRNCWSLLKSISLKMYLTYWVNVIE